MREQTGGGSGGHGPKCAQSIVKAGKGGLKRLIIKMMSVSLARERNPLTSPIKVLKKRMNDINMLLLCRHSKMFSSLVTEHEQFVQIQILWFTLGSR